MGNPLRRLCVICARGGSKGVPNKNVRNLGGSPLISHTIRQAFASKLFEEVAVSSDSNKILEFAKAAGASLLVRRPDSLASDSAGKGPSVAHCVQEVEGCKNIKFDTVVDLDVTAPLRHPNDIVQAVAKLETSGAPNLFSVCESHRSPYFNLVERGTDGEVKLVKPSEDRIMRRQDAPACYDMNASIYVWRRDALRTGEETLFRPGTELFVMPKERSVDIDSEFDFELVELLLARSQSRKP